jgi:hypothetical protein
MKVQLKKGSTSNILQIFIADSSSTTGAGLTGLTNASSGLTAYYHRDTDTTATAISLVTMTVGTFTSSGFKEIDATNMPGWYQFCPPNAAVASGAASCAFHLKGATNMAPLPLEVELIAYDPQDSVRLGLTALPNAAAEAAGGLYTRGSGAGQINQPANGQIDVNTVKVGGTTQTARDLGASVLISSGTGTGQLDVTSGVIKANLAQILGTALTETAGQIAAAFKQFFDVASPTGTMKAITNVVTTTNLTTNNDKTGYALTSAYDSAKTASQAGDVMKVSSGTGANQISLSSGQVTVGTNNDKTGYSLTQTFPVNFASLSIDASGQLKLQNPVSIAKNVALNNFQFMMFDSTNHTPKTGLTPTVQIIKDGGAVASSTNAAVEISNGVYKINFTQTEMNASVITLIFSATGADTYSITFTTNVN